MTEVTVQLEDLEALVFSTGVINTVEGAIAIFRRDPFSHPKIPLSEAHSRLAAAMRQATRAQAGTLVNWDEPLTEEERKLLQRVEKGENKLPWIIISPDEKAPKSGQPMSLVDRLMCKGCVVMGQLAYGIVWSDNPEYPALQADPSGFAVKITPRGKQKLE